MTEFQTSLLLIGAVLIVGVFAYNKWLEKRASRVADNAFRADHPDVLVDVSSPETASNIQQPDGERVEPELSRASFVVAKNPLKNAGDAEIGPPKSDYIVELTFESPVASIKILELWTEIEHRFARRTSLSGMIDGEWRLLKGTEDGAMVRATLQLVSRKGVISESELLEFRSGVETIAGKLGASASSPEMREALERARELDAICADADIQIAFHVVAMPGASFLGTKLRAAAEASGFALEEDGCFTLRDDLGRALYSLSDRGGVAFSASMMKDADPQALTLAMDVPRVPDTQHTFQAMVRFGRHLASILSGSLVDDNGQPLDERAIASIDAQLSVVCRSLKARGVEPGGELALRLFS